MEPLYVQIGPVVTATATILIVEHHPNSSEERVRAGAPSPMKKVVAGEVNPKLRGSKENIFCAFSAHLS